MLDQNPPTHIIWEDSDSAVIIPSHFMYPGHVLVIPKVEIGSVYDLPPELYQKLWDVVRKMEKVIKKAIQCERVGTAIEGFGVPDHAHIHLIPLTREKKYDTTRVYVASEAEKTEVAKKLKSALAELSF